MSADPAQRILLHRDLVPAFEEWVGSQGLMIGVMPSPPDPDWWIIAPVDEVIAAKLRRET